MATNILEVNMYRYNPEEDKFPYIKQYQIEKTCKRHHGFGFIASIKRAR